jgi:hypothetical protein
MLSDPSPYYLLIFILLLAINKFVLSKTKAFAVGSGLSIVFETAVMLAMWVYAFYVIANHYHGFSV